MHSCQPETAETAADRPLNLWMMIGKILAKDGEVRTARHNGCRICETSRDSIIPVEIVRGGGVKQVLRHLQALFIFCLNPGISRPEGARFTSSQMVGKDVEVGVPSAGDVHHLGPIAEAAVRQHVEHVPGAGSTQR